jgi:hypothetical protein
MTFKKGDQTNLKHGHSSRSSGVSKTYCCWRNMKNRCLNQNVPEFKYYGAMGISVCKKWLVFENFLKDMGEAREGMTLDRIDNSKGYHSKNCRWVPMREQNRNRKSNLYFNFEGERICLKDLCLKKKVNYQMIRRRLLRGYSVAEAFKKPPRITSQNKHLY